MGKAANLVQAAGVPSLGDELNLAEDGIVGDGGDQGGIVESLADAASGNTVATARARRVRNPEKRRK